MNPVPALSAFWSSAKGPFPHDVNPSARIEDGAGDQPFPSTALPTRKEWRVALAVVLVSVAIFAVAVPFAGEKLPEYGAFIPIYQSALTLNELITAALLFAQFSILRSRALLVLACGYLFTAGMVVAHALSFPGLFAPGGLMGSGPQTTAWLFMFWHAGFPIAVIAYARMKDFTVGTPVQFSARDSILYAVGIVCVGVIGFTLLATSGHGLLPEIMRGSVKVQSTMLPVLIAICALTLAALVELWRRPRHTTIDLWLMVTMCVWLFDMALSTVFNRQRFDVGFYAGRLYGLSAATFILIVLLTKTTALYARLSRLLDTEQIERRRESEMRQRIFDTSLDLIIVVDRRGTLLHVSPSSEAILGYRPAEMVGRSGTDFLHPDDLEHTRGEMRQARRGSPIRVFDCRYVHKDGRIVPLSWKGMWSEPDQQHYFVGRDMTERINLEQQLRQAQKMEAIGQLTGGIAHDFNNILAVIIGMTELAALSVAGDAKLAAMIKQIDESAERGAQLVKRMLAFARKQPLQAGIVDVNEAVERSVAILERTLGEHIAVESVLGKDLWPALVDPSQLQDAIVNLAVNARDAMPDGGRLVIETVNANLDEDYVAKHADVAAGDYVLVNVTDSGTGMPPEVVERVFEPFFTTKEVGRGTGLGLSMVYGFVKQSKGHVKIYSEVGHGTSVRLYFPRAVQQQPALPADASTTGPAPLPTGRETILVVEDDASVRNMTVNSLEGLGYKVREAVDGKSGLEIVREGGPIDLLFTDMIMPNGMSGLELIRAARELRPDLKVLLTSGYSEQFVRPSGVRLLGKPYRRDKLATAIRAALDAEPPLRRRRSDSPLADPRCSFGPCGRTPPPDASNELAPCVAQVGRLVQVAALTRRASSSPLVRAEGMPSAQGEVKRGEGAVLELSKSAAFWARAGTTSGGQPCCVTSPRAAQRSPQPRGSSLLPLPRWPWPRCSRSPRPRRSAWRWWWATRPMSTPAR